MQCLKILTYSAANNSHVSIKVKKTNIQAFSDVSLLLSDASKAVGSISELSMSTKKSDIYIKECHPFPFYTDDLIIEIDIHK